MGNSWTRELRDGTAQSPNSVTPKQDSPPTFDPMLGFPSGRVPRVMTVSAEEMEAVQLQPWEKNYCADLHVKVVTGVYRTIIIINGLFLVQAKVCHHENFAAGWRCSHIKHEVDHCLREDYKLRMMEYERERRLRQRAQRIAASQSADDEE